MTDEKEEKEKEKGNITLQGQILRNTGNMIGYRGPKGAYENKEQRQTEWSTGWFNNCKTNHSDRPVAVSRQTNTGYSTTPPTA